MRIRRVISGGQTGVDRAALDAAIAAGLDFGGWAPKGLWAEDGPIPARYGLIETPGADVQQRTEWNVRDSDATLVISSAPPTGGTAFTKECARRYGKPLFHVDPRRAPPEALARQIASWLAELDGQTLNIAGPRASEDRMIYDLAHAVLGALLAESS